MTHMQSTQYFSDAALTNSGRDRFRRAPFACAIAATLSSLPDESGIAIGIYGPWGDGKTTVLSFIEEALRNNNKVIVIPFNPWRFGNEDELLLNFFQSLVETVGESLSGFKEVVNDWKDLACFIPQLGNATEKLLAKMTYQNLEAFKRKTEKILGEAGKRIVVLMDDIDRLETKEIQAVFRLIKLTASFNNIAYVLAFDDKVVSAALQEKYGTVSQSGHGFLEKIIQVPLHLPKIPTVVLLDFCHTCVAEAQSAATLTLTEEEEHEFRDNFALLATLIHTPRQCKRYANGVAFALLMLKGEVNSVDLLLIEALRVFHSELYEIIRSHRHYFIADDGTGSLSNMTRQQFETEVMGPAWHGLNIQERDALRTLLVRLFPDFGMSKLQGGQTPLYDRLADRQRLASKHYFDRFFAYSIPADEIADTEIATLLRAISDQPIQEIAHRIQSMINSTSPKGADAFIFRIGLRRMLLEPFISANLARGIATVSKNFTYLHNDSEPFLNYSDAVLLVRQLILNAPDKKRHALVADIVENAASVPFAFCCLQAAAEMRTDQKPWWNVYGSFEYHDDPEAPITGDEYRTLARILSTRILSYFGDPASYEVASRTQSTFLVRAWLHCTPKEEVRSHLEIYVQANPRYAVGIINWYVSDDPFSAEIVALEIYDFITSLVGATILMEAIEREYSDALRSDESVDPRLKLAQAFLKLHAKWEATQQ